MQYEIKPATLPDAVIRDIVREAEADAGDDAKPALVKALVSHLAAEFAASAVKPWLAERHEMSEMLGESSGGFMAALEGEFAPVDVGSLIAEGGLLDQIDGLSYRIARALIERVIPAQKDYGKWLAKYGIVAQHIKAISKTAAAETPPPPPNETSDDLAAMLGGGSSAMDAAPPPPSSTSPAPSAADGTATTPPPPAVGVSVNEAFQHLYAAIDSPSEGLIKRLGVSRSTLGNYLTGKTQRIKLSPEQARIMAAECDVRSSRLRAAAEIFARIV